MNHVSTINISAIGNIISFFSFKESNEQCKHRVKYWYPRPVVLVLRLGRVQVIRTSY